MDTGSTRPHHGGWGWEQDNTRLKSLVRGARCCECCLLSPLECLPCLAVPPWLCLLPFCSLSQTLILPGFREDWCE